MNYQNKTISEAGHDRVDETKSGNADGPDEAVEGHGEYEVEGPPAGGRQGRSYLDRAQRDQLAQVEPG